MAKKRKSLKLKSKKSDLSPEKCCEQTECVSVKLEIGFDPNKYDSSNPLVITKKWPQLKAKNINEKKKQKINNKVLSKKQKKILEKVLLRKKKKIDRVKLLSDLQDFKAGEDEYALMSSTSGIQTLGRRRFDEFIVKNKANDESCKEKWFKYKKIKRSKIEYKHEIISNKDLNVVGLTDSLSDSDIDDNNIETNEKSLDNDNQICNNTEHNEKQNHIVIPHNNKVDTISKESKIDGKNEMNAKTLINAEIKIKSVFVNIDRKPEIEKSRSALPIVSEEHIIMDAIYYNPVVIICGETGSGKTTQVPQFLYEGGYVSNKKMIAVTEPRRVAAIAMSKRIAHEMNVSDDIVSYQIRFDGNVTPQTNIKFMTDGVLLKEIQNDFLLTKYSVVIIDEAHERSLYSDILIGLLSRIVPLRSKKCDPLKLIIMSATLKVQDFTANQRLFKITPPVLKIDSRQFPVSIHFNKKTNDDYIHEAFKKVCKIHCESSSGGILVFVTGRQEVEYLCKKLKTKFPQNTNLINNEYQDLNISTKRKHKNNENKKGINSLTADTYKSLEFIQTVNLDDYDVNPLEKERVSDDFDYSDDESNADISDDNEMDFNETYKSSQPLYCLPLYSMLPQSKQALVFNSPLQGSRLCVIATNVAETSLTIPNIKYVVDSGKFKAKLFDGVTGISTFHICWTSKASADQRAGRAGRTGPGHCYRLYSSAIFNDEFPQFSEPEIIRKPADDLLLQMKSMNIENVVNFPFPSQPSMETLIASEKRLVLMGALERSSEKCKSKKSEYKTKITALGKAMSSFPISPRYAKMLALSRQQQLMSYTIAIVSALTVQELFINSNHKKAKKHIFSGDIQSSLLGDVMELLNAIGAAQYAGFTHKFCQLNGLRYNAIIEINKLRSQLTNQVSQLANDSHVMDLEMKIPNEIQIKLLRQILLSGFFDHVCRRIPDYYIDIEDKKRLIKNAYQSIELETPVFLSQNSILIESLPEYVVYQEIFETNKLYMRNVVAIEPEWIPIYATNLCTFSNPSDSPPPRYDSLSDSIKCFRASVFGPHQWSLPQTEVDYPSGLEKYKYFAKFLLEGEIISFFKTHSKSLLSSPSIIIKSWASLQPRTGKLIQTLISQKIDNKRALLANWETDSNYLLKEYLLWLPNALHHQIKISWPPNS